MPVVTKTAATESGTTTTYSSASMASALQRADSDGLHSEVCFPFRCACCCCQVCQNRFFDVLTHHSSPSELKLPRSGDKTVACDTARSDWRRTALLADGVRRWIAAKTSLCVVGAFRVSGRMHMITGRLIPSTVLELSYGRVSSKLLGWKIAAGSALSSHRICNVASKTRGVRSAQQLELQNFARGPCQPLAFICRASCVVILQRSRLLRSCAANGDHVMGQLPRRSFAGKEVSVIGDHCLHTPTPAPASTDPFNWLWHSVRAGTQAALCRAGVGCSPFGHAYGVRPRDAVRSSVCALTP